MALVAGQALDRRWLGEGVADEAHAALGVEALAVEGDDAGRFLAAMLQGVQAERGDRGGVGMAEDAEDAAFLAQAVAVEIEIAGSWRLSELRDHGQGFGRPSRCVIEPHMAPRG